MADIEIRENGAAVTVSQGDRIILRLAENATTGYQWVSELTDGLDLESSEIVPPGEVMPGAAGERVIVLRATRRGHGKAELTLTRPWESGKEPLDRWRVSVTVN